MKLIVDENNLYYGLFLENDNTGDILESKVLEEGFRKQNKRHITILGGSTKELLKNILNKLSEEEKNNILKEIKGLLEDLRWVYTLKDIYKIQKQGYFNDSNILENRESFISMIDMPDMEIFYNKLNSLLKTNLPVQVPHITLFTKGERENPNYYGIPVPSIQEFNNMNPEKIL